MSRFIDETGNVYGQLTVLKRAKNVNGRTRWLCRCTCGAELTVSGQALRDGAATRCRTCANIAIHDAQVTDVGLHPAEHAAWRNMIARCAGNREEYGGRGISVCERWLGDDGFAHFLADLGPRPVGRYSLDRIDVNGDYCPANCRWANDHTQAVNRRSTVFLEVNGKCMSLTDWERTIGVGRGVVGDRLKCGWAPKLAVVADAVRVSIPAGGQVDDFAVTDAAPATVKLGQKFGDLEVIAALAPIACGHPRVLCRCTLCGGLLAVHERTLTAGYMTSCGCSPVTNGEMRRRRGGKVNVDDQRTRRARTAWSNLRQMCVNRRNPRFNGARSLTLTSFAAFLKTVGLPPSSSSRLVCPERGVCDADTVHWSDGVGDAVVQQQHAWNFIDLTGKQFGRLTVIGQNGKRHGHIMWQCRCTCGKEVEVNGQDLRKGLVKSCGCLRAEVTRKRSLKHGISRRWQQLYANMHRRCEDPRNKRYSRYGARGVYVCERWSGKDGLINFVEDVATTWPGPGWTLDRIDNDGPYSPENTRWATPNEQANNTSRTRWLTTSTGESHPVREWERIKGLKRGTIVYRLDVCGYTPDEAVKPVDYRRKED